MVLGEMAIHRFIPIMWCPQTLDWKSEYLDTSMGRIMYSKTTWTIIGITLCNSCLIFIHFSLVSVHNLELVLPSNILFSWPWFHQFYILSSFLWLFSIVNDDGTWQANPTHLISGQRFWIVSFSSCCSYSFTGFISQALVGHSQLKMSSISVRMVNAHDTLCQICGIISQHRMNYETHMRTHTKEKPFRCPICDKGLVTKGSLTLHLRVHSGEKPFECNICGKRFAQKCHMNSHQIIHMNKLNWILNWIWRCNR
jgi:transcription elongation factor Elf1